MSVGIGELRSNHQAEPGVELQHDVLAEEVNLHAEQRRHVGGLTLTDAPRLVHQEVTGAEGDQERGAES